jgi:hypothetical protein
MNRRFRSALLNELLHPLQRPQVVLTDPTPTPTPWGTALPAELFPVAIVPNHNFVPQLFTNFCNFCEQHPGRGNDPDRIASIRVTRQDCATNVLRTKYEVDTFLSSTIFPTVRYALRALEQDPLLHFGPRQYEPATGTHADFFWYANGTVRLIWQSKSPVMADAMFDGMDVIAQRRPRFSLAEIQGRTFADAISIIFKVRSPFFLSNGRYKLMVFFQAAVEASYNNSRYVIFYSGTDMIVHRHVPIAGSRNQYYLEASQRFPIDSKRYPHMAVLAAIIFGARCDIPAAPLPATNVPRFHPDRRTTRAMRRSQDLTLISNSETPHPYGLRSGLGPRSQSVRSPSHYIFAFQPFLLT